MLVPLTDVLRYAEEKKIAIGAFNVTSFEALRGLVQAAEEEDLPLILQFAPRGHSVYLPQRFAGPLLLAVAREAKVPTAVHLDHGSSLDVLRWGLEQGFSSVMFDGSALPFEENITQTQEASRLTRAAGASLEAELGALGVGEDGEASVERYTDPEQAEIFARETEIDALACSFGTVHGLYKSQPCLDVPRIAEIHRRTGLPIVMHGGSGVSDAEYARCIEAGVRKINYYTYAARDVGVEVCERLAEAAERPYMHTLSNWASEAFYKHYLRVMRLFAGRN